MGTIPHDIRRLLDDCEMFVTEILENEALSEDAQESRKVLLNNFRVVHNRNPQEFPSRYSPDEDGSDGNRSPSLGRSGPSDDASVASDYQDDGGPECESTTVWRKKGNKLESEQQTLAQITSDSQLVPATRSEDNGVKL
ncbi:hypothetical protein INR49_005839 [Caranx melampygus]|nr:hypothetical protein INR49_005839 [Caranx melampygus]